MPSVASSSQRIDGAGPSSSARCGRAVITFIYCIVLLTATVWTEGDESYAVSINAAMSSDLDSDVMVVSPRLHLRMAAVKFYRNSLPTIDLC
jgi:hypothetical protein